MTKLEELLLDKIKCQGLFDKIRKSCISEIEVLDDFNSLMSDIEIFTREYLDNQAWPPNRSQKDLREDLRRSIFENIQIKNKLRMIVNQCILLKNSDEFVPQINNVVWDYFKDKKNSIKIEEKPKSNFPINTNLASYSDDEMDLVSENSEDIDKSSINLSHSNTSIHHGVSSSQENNPVLSSKSNMTKVSNSGKVEKPIRTEKNPSYSNSQSGERDGYSKTRDTSHSKRSHHRESSESSNQPKYSSSKRWYQSCEYDKYRDKKYSSKSISSHGNEDNYHGSYHDSSHSRYSHSGHRKNYESTSRSSYRDRFSRDYGKHEKRFNHGRSHHTRRERDESFKRSSSRHRSSSNENFSDRRRHKDLDFMDYYENSMKSLTSASIDSNNQRKSKYHEKVLPNDIKANELDLRRRREEIEARLREIEEQEMAVKKASESISKSPGSLVHSPSKRLEKSAHREDDEVYDPEDLDFS